MSFFTGKNLISVLLSVVSISFLIYANSTGITGMTRKNGNGCTCHNQDPTPSVVVTINGPSTLSLGETAQYTVTISGGPLIAAGTNIAASSGTLIPGAGLKIVNGELTHTSPKTPVNGVVTFSFSYTATMTQGSVLLFANGNSVNMNGNNSGDQWNFAENKLITLGLPSDVNDKLIIDNFSLAQNFPNPFNPSTSISYTLGKKSFVSLKIYDITGKEISSLVNANQTEGKYSVNFNAAKLSSGIYFYSLKTDYFSETRKMILTK